MNPRLGSATLSQLAFPGKGNPNFPWEKSHSNNTVVKKLIVWECWAWANYPDTYSPRIFPLYPREYFRSRLVIHPRSRSQGPLKTASLRTNPQRSTFKISSWFGQFPSHHRGSMTAAGPQVSESLHSTGSSSLHRLVNTTPILLKYTARLR